MVFALESPGTDRQVGAGRECDGGLEREDGRKTDSTDHARCTRNILSSRRREQVATVVCCYLCRAGGGSPVSKQAAVEGEARRREEGG